MGATQRPAPHARAARDTPMPRMRFPPPPAARRRAVRWIAAAVVAAAVVVGIAHVTGSPASDITMLGCTAVAAVGFFRARRSRSWAEAWRCSDGAQLPGGPESASWLGVESLSHSASGLNPVSGSFMLAGSSPRPGGMLTLPGAPSSAGSRLRLALDCLLVASSTLFVAWRPFVEPAMAHSHRGV